MIKDVKERWKRDYRPNPPQLNGNGRRQTREPTFIDQYLLRHRGKEDRDAFDAFVEGAITFLANDDNVFQWFILRIGRVPVKIRWLVCFSWTGTSWTYKDSFPSYISTRLGLIFARWRISSASTIT